MRRPGSAMFDKFPPRGGGLQRENLLAKCPEQQGQYPVKLSQIKIMRKGGTVQIKLILLVNVGLILAE